MSEHCTKNASLLPLFIDVSDKRILVVGGGSVATRKVKSLVDTACNLVVIAPEISSEIEEVASRNAMHIERRSFEEADLENCFLVFAATDDSALNAQIEQMCGQCGILVNRADNSASEVIVPSVMRRGSLQVAVSTSGASPTLSRSVRQKIEAVIDDAYATYTDFLSQLRALALESVNDPRLRRAFFMQLDHESYLERIRGGEILDATFELETYLHAISEDC